LKEYGKEPNKDNKIMTNAYYEVIKSLWNRKNNNKSISPYDFKEILSQENPLFAGNVANDSKDLINFLIERFHQELNKIHEAENNISYNQIDNLDEQKMLNLFLNDFKTKYDSIISHLFYGVLETKAQCQQCKYIKYNFQIYSFIEFPLERVNQYCFQNGMRANYNMYNNNNNKNPDIDIYECFQYYNNFELMTGENQMYCNMCNSTCDSLYGTILYSPPNYLVINLNRGRGAVYECKVNFYEKLDLSNYFALKSQNIFELYAVICHIGPSSMSGHFVAYCKNSIDKKWYKYNDSMVNECKNKHEYKDGMPYILFYQTL
jgi:ubiquitin C-terminal hydrolase